MPAFGAPRLHVAQTPTLVPAAHGRGSARERLNFNLLSEGQSHIPASSVRERVNFSTLREGQFHTLAPSPGLPWLNHDRSADQPWLTANEP